MDIEFTFPSAAQACRYPNDLFDFAARLPIQIGNPFCDAVNVPAGPSTRSQAQAA
jgi:hypothetical protein